MGVWIIQALKNDFAVSLLTSQPVDLEHLNRFHGTSIRASDLKIVRPNTVTRTILNLDPDPNSIQLSAYVMRICHRIRPQYDLVISSGTEEADVGAFGLSYIHYPYLSGFWGKYVIQA